MCFIEKDFRVEVIKPDLKISDPVKNKEGINGKIISLQGSGISNPDDYYTIELDEPDRHGCTIICVPKTDFWRMVYPESCKWTDEDLMNYGKLCLSHYLKPTGGFVPADLWFKWRLSEFIETFKKQAMIIITEKTKNTPSIRLKIYEEAMKSLKAGIKVDDCVGLCYYITHSYYVKKGCNSRFFCAADSEIEINYPELWKHRPKRAGAYWFPLSKYGEKKRVKILQSAIKEIENKLKK